MQDEQICRNTIATFMLTAVLGGLVFQVPVGRLSDRFDRQSVLAALSFGLPEWQSRWLTYPIPN
jgi:hypothetical protein